MVLRSDGERGDFRGAILVPPGDHPVTVEAFDGSGDSLATATVHASAPRGPPVQLDVTLRASANGASGPRSLIESIDVPGSSVVVGDSLPLRARLAATAGKATARWSAAPAGCATFANPEALSTVFAAAAAGTCNLVIQAGSGQETDRRTVGVVVRTRGERDRYPLHVSANGRHLVDARGAPFLIKGESAWLALANLTESEQESYLADRSARGFNLVEIMLINHDYTQAPNPTPPANRTGQEPFLRPKDFSTPNDAYFDRAVAFVDRAAAHGVAVLLAPVYLGFDGGPEGWWDELNSPVNTRAVCAAFGRYLGKKFKDRSNVIWLAGGDFAPPRDSEGEARHHAILRGIREAGASQIWTGHWNLLHEGGISTDEALFAQDMALNGVYQYANPYKYAARAWQVQPPRPVFLLESAYEREHGKSQLQPFRKAWWWVMTTGGSGMIWGNSFLWMCETARGRYRALYGDSDGTESSWAAELQSPGTQEALHLHAFFEGITWWRLVPLGLDRRPDPIAAGQLPGDRHIAVAASPEGDLLVAYVPPNAAGIRNFALDLSYVRRGTRARWYDPSTGVFLPGARLPPKEAEVELESPGKNGSGVNDWVLLVDTPERTD